MKRRFIILIALLLIAIPIISFLALRKKDDASLCNTLTRAQNYAASLEEYPDIDNENWLKPNYTSFYKKNTRGWLQKIWDTITFSEKPAFPAPEFQHMLEKVTSARENNGFIGRFVQKTHPEDKQQFIILGDLHGSFHSLVRDLNFLYKKEIIDNTLKLKDGYSLVFNGNAIDLSPYTLETMLMILYLMDRNPKSVYYVRGTHEDKEHWKNFGLRKELELRAPNIQEKLVKRFFNTLPLALYIIAKNGPQTETLRISPFGRTYTELDEENFSDFFLLDDQNGKTEVRSLAEKVTGKKPVNIKAIIKTEERLGKFTQTEGLVQADSDKGSTAWMVLSAPNRTFRSLYKFFFDAFAVVTVNGKLDDWTITLYNQDVREQLGIHKRKEYKVASGDEIVPETKQTRALKAQVSKLQADLNKCKSKSDASETCKKEVEKLKKELEKTKKTTPKPEKKPVSAKASSGAGEKPKVEKSVVAKKAMPDAAKEAAKAEPKKKAPKPEKEKPTDSGDIIVGTTLGLTGNIAEESASVKTGLELRIKQENDKGGINGRKIRLVVLDDEYKPANARKNVEELINKYKTDIILFPIGSATTKSYLDLVKEKKVVVLFSASGSMALRSPTPEYFIHLRPSYPDMFYALVTYAKTKLDAKKFAIFAQSDVVAEGLKPMLEKALIDPTDYAEITHKRNITDMSEQSAAVLKYKPDALVLWTTSAASMALLKEVGAENLLKTTIMGADLGNPKFNQFLKGMGLFDKYIDAQALPNPETSQLQIIKDCRTALGGKPIDGLLLEAYVSASLFIYLAKQTGGTTDKAKIIKAAEDIKNLDFGGLKLNFNPKYRRLSDTIWLSTGKNWTPVNVDK